MFEERVEYYFEVNRKYKNLEKQKLENRIMKNKNQKIHVNFTNNFC